MYVQTITAAYLSVLALMYTILIVLVVGMRRGNRIGFGEGGNAALRAAIRAHAHFAEYVPIIVLMLGALELFGTRAVQLHMLLGTLVVSRILHPFGLAAKPGSAQFFLGRVLGMTLTLFVLVTSALMLLQRLVLS